MRGTNAASGRGYESVAWFDSVTREGVRFGVFRMSLGRRLDLARRVREIGRKAEFFEAGLDVRDRIEAVSLGAEIDREYLEWGLAAVEGFSIDGEPATPRLVIDRGPMELASEILARVKAECGLSEDERKN